MCHVIFHCFDWSLVTGHGHRILHWSDLSLGYSQGKRDGESQGQRSSKFLLKSINLVLCRYDNFVTRPLQLRPRCMLFGGQSAIISLCFVKNYTGDRDRIVSLSEGG